MKTAAYVVQTDHDMHIYNTKQTSSQHTSHIVISRCTVSQQLNLQIYDLCHLWTDCLGTEIIFTQCLYRSRSNLYFLPSISVRGSMIPYNDWAIVHTHTNMCLCHQVVSK